MHIQECEHPKRIYNKYVGEFMYVPCGSCPSCLRRKASEWITRLDVERKCWKYAVFFTLTYADEHCPRLTRLGNHLVDLRHEHTAKGQDAPCIDLAEYYGLPKEDSEKLYAYLSANDYRYLSVYDCQCFIKRLRKNLKNTIKNKFEDYNEKDYQVRYYLVGEYGPTTYRPHYHGLLFFSSEREAAVIQEVLSSSWKLGIVDSSFVSGSNSRYVAKYVNSTANLPRVLTHTSIRQFALFSKCPPIGTLYFKNEEIQEIFFRASPQMSVDYFKGLSVRDVPLWRSITNRLYPKISGYSKFSNQDRVVLYRVFEKYQEYGYTETSSCTFADFLIKKYEDYQQNRLIPVFSPFYLHLYHDYVDYLRSNGDDLKASLIRWYNLSARVCMQAAAFDISVRDYVSKIDEFYNNVEYEKLKLQYKFEDDFSKTYLKDSLAGIDKLWLESLLDVPLCDMSAEEIAQLQSFNIDIEKFTSDDLSVRLPYQDTLLPVNQRDYWNVVVDNDVWLKKHTKSKIKNDYLDSHPQFKLLIH